jgi:hypothetical protein
MPLGLDMKRLGVDLPQHIPEVEIRLVDLRDVLAADLTQVSLFTNGHPMVLPGSTGRVALRCVSARWRDLGVPALWVF